MATARWVLPVPVPPTSTMLRLPSRKSPPASSWIRGSLTGRAENRGEPVSGRPEPVLCKDVHEVFLECVDPLEERPGPRMIILMPSVGKVLSGIDRIADVLLPVPRALDEPQGSKRLFDHAVLDKPRMSMQLRDDRGQSCIDIGLVPIQMRRQGCDDH